MRIPRDLSGQELTGLLKRYGYQITRQTGSHLRLTTTMKGEASEERLSETTGGKKSRPDPRRSWTPWVLCIVYVNEQSVLTPKFGKHNVQIRYVEPEFKRLTEV